MAEKNETEYVKEKKEAQIEIIESVLRLPRSWDIDAEGLLIPVRDVERLLEELKKSL